MRSKLVVSSDERGKCTLTSSQLGRGGESHFESLAHVPCGLRAIGTSVSVIFLSPFWLLNMVVLIVFSFVHIEMATLHRLMYPNCSEALIMLTTTNEYKHLIFFKNIIAWVIKCFLDKLRTSALPQICELLSN